MTRSKTHDRMCALSNSLPGAIRWRFCDYEQFLKKELQLLAAPAAGRQGPQRSSRERRSR